MLPALLAGFPDQELNGITTTTAPLFIAARSGCVAAVVAILDADEEIEVDWNVLRPWFNKSYTALE
jgi:hypothetical protein